MKASRPAFTLSLRRPHHSVSRFYAHLPRLQVLSRMQECSMDIVWIAALAALWALMAWMVIGLNRLESPKGERP
jgi:hypothetical protein